MVLRKYFFRRETGDKEIEKRRGVYDARYQTEVERREAIQERQAVGIERG